MSTYAFTNDETIKSVLPSADPIARNNIKSSVATNSNLKNSVVSTNSCLEECATLVNAILRFLAGNEVEMPIPSEQGDSFSAYADITRDRSAKVLVGVKQIAEALGIDM